MTSHLLWWNWNASLLNSTWGYNFNWRNTSKQNACSNLSCTLVMEDGCQKSKKLSYTAKFKREVIRCAEDKGHCRATAIFGVDESNVSLWRNTRQRSAGVKRHEKNSLDPKKGWFPEIDDAVLTFFPETQDWTVCELWSTSRGGDKKGQIFEHSSKSF